MSETLTAEMPREALDWCRRLVKRRAGNFYWGLRLLPEPRRSAMYAIYAWMRQADDIADDDHDIPHARAALAVFAETSRTLLSGGSPPRDPMWEALAWAARTWSLPVEPFDDMLRGQSDDLSGRVIETSEDLLEYCRMVASTVGVLCITVWGYEGEEAVELAVQRGIALQLTNVLRDVGADIAQGRCYLPAAHLSERGLDPASLAAWSRPEACEAFVRSWIGEARSRYESSAPLDGMVAADCRGTLRAMTAIYAALLDRIDRDPSRVCGVPGVRLSKLAKIRIALRACRNRP